MGMGAKTIEQQLRDAAKCGKTDLVCDLLAHGADAKHAGPFGDTALTLAAEKGHAACVRVLLTHSDPASRAKVMSDFQPDKAGKLRSNRLDMKSDLGHTALMQAAFYGHAECVKLLLPVSDARSTGGVCAETALMLAASEGHADCVALLLPASDPKFRDRHTDSTALIKAAQDNHLAAVRALLPHSDIGAKDMYQLTASDWAKQQGHPKLGKFIDAYELALSEMTQIAAAVGMGARQVGKGGALRV